MLIALSSSPVSVSAPATQVHREFEHECIHLFSEVVNLLGIPPSAGQIYGLLFASLQPLSFSDIVERLKISKGSASQGLQLLRTLEAIKQIAPPETRSNERLTGSARNYYEPELGLRKLVSGLLQERVAPLAAAGADRLGRLREMVEKNEKTPKFFLGRVKQLQTWQRRLSVILPVLSALLGSKLPK